MLVVFKGEGFKQRIGKILNGEDDCDKRYINYDGFLKQRGKNSPPSTDIHEIICLECCELTEEALTKLRGAESNPPVVIISDGYSSHFQNILSHDYRYILGMFQLNELEGNQRPLASLQQNLQEVKEEAEQEKGFDVGSLYKKTQQGGKDFASLFVPPMREFMLELRRAFLGLDVGELQLQESREVDEKIYCGKGGKKVAEQLDARKGPLLEQKGSGRNIKCILIEGETGAGKSFAAKWIHEKHFADYKFREINCANLSSTLLESQLFGHMKGSFTSADQTVPGIFLMAYGGLVLLDEIGDMDITVQPKLLKYLEEGKLSPFGWHEEPIYCPCLLVAATNVDLEKKVEEGTFREDLYYRISSRRVRIPPLRERMADLDLLVDMILQDPTINAGQQVKYVSNDALGLLRKYDYPGNFRELEAILGRAVYKADMDRSDTVLSRHIELRRTEQKKGAKKKSR